MNISRWDDFFQINMGQINFDLAPGKELCVVGMGKLYERFAAGAELMMLTTTTTPIKTTTGHSPIQDCNK
jgi:hypothetical protein